MLMSISSALGGNTGCKCAVSILMPLQELVILWVTLPSGWDTRPDWGHELVLDLLPGVLLEVCLDGTRLRNLPLQFYAEQNKKATNAAEQTGKNPPLLLQLTSLITLPSPPPKPGPCSIPPPPLAPPGPSPCPVSHSCSSQALPSQSLVLPQVSAQGTELRVLLCSPPAAYPVPPCSLYNEEYKIGSWYRAAAWEATLLVEVNSISS